MSTHALAAAVAPRRRTATTHASPPSSYSHPSSSPPFRSHHLGSTSPRYSSSSSDPEAQLSSSSLDEDEDEELLNSTPGKGGWRSRSRARRGRGGEEIRMRSMGKKSGSGSGKDRVWEMRSGGKKKHLTKKQRSWCIGLFLLLLIVLGGLSYWKFGEWWVTAYDEGREFVVFPEVTTPPDWTKLGISVFNGITSTLAGAFSTATAAIGGAVETAVDGVKEVTNVAKVTDVFKDVGGAFKGAFGG